MELRHLRYFVAVAEELHFARAAERLHIEQSPLSRAIKDLEYDLGARLFERTTRSTRITWAGQVFLAEARDILCAVDQARRKVSAAAKGLHGHLRIGVSDGVTQPRLAALLRHSHHEEPKVEIRLLERSFAQTVRGLLRGRLDAGFALSAEVGEGLVAEPIWHDPLALVMGVDHPLAEQVRIELTDVLPWPLVLCHPEHGSGGSQQVETMLARLKVKPIAVEHVTTLGMMLTLVGSRPIVGLTLASQLETVRRPDVIVRPLARAPMHMTTYLVRTGGEPSEPLARFIQRARPAPEIS